MKRILLCALALLTTASIAHAQTETHQFGEGQAQTQSAHSAHRTSKHVHAAHAHRKHAAHRHAVHRTHRKHHAASARKRT